MAEWRDTRDTLQLYTQVVGKVRLANEPRANHWWNAPLYITARGLVDVTPFGDGYRAAMCLVVPTSGAGE